MLGGRSELLLVDRRGDLLQLRDRLRIGRLARLHLADDICELRDVVGDQLEVALDLGGHLLDELLQQLGFLLQVAAVRRTREGLGQLPVRLQEVTALAGERAEAGRGHGAGRRRGLRRRGCFGRRGLCRGRLGRGRLGRDRLRRGRALASSAAAAGESDGEREHDNAEEESRRSSHEWAALGEVPAPATLARTSACADHPTEGATSAPINRTMSRSAWSRCWRKTRSTPTRSYSRSRSTTSSTVPPRARSLPISSAGSRPVRPATRSARSSTCSRVAPTTQPVISENAIGGRPALRQAASIRARRSRHSSTVAKIVLYSSA